MTEKATLEAPACGLEETASESAHQPPDPTASAAPAAPTATDPALPREGDESWGGRRGEAVMAGSGGG